MQERSPIYSASAVAISNPDFMHDGYLLIQEPLNLLARGQQWFKRIHAQEPIPIGHGLVLGATPWLAALMARRQRRTIIADMSAAMLELAQCLLKCETPSIDESTIEYVDADWRDMPRFDEPFDVVVGDNSLNFLEFPRQWISLLDSLASRMSQGAKLIVRACSVPTRHRTRSVQEIAAQFMNVDSMNCTEARAALLFSHWDSRTYGIDTARVLESFEANIDLFRTLIEKHGIAAENDLVTVRKYRNAAAVYFAPPLPEIIDAIGKRFDVTSVHFGPLPMSDYFPLIVAVKR